MIVIQSHREGFLNVMQGLVTVYLQDFAERPDSAKRGIYFGEILLQRGKYFSLSTIEDRFERNSPGEDNIFITCAVGLMNNKREMLNPGDVLFENKGYYHIFTICIESAKDYSWVPRFAQLTRLLFETIVTNANYQDVERSLSMEEAEQYEGPIVTGPIIYEPLPVEESVMKAEIKEVIIEEPLTTEDEELAYIDTSSSIIIYEGIEYTLSEIESMVYQGKKGTPQVLKDIYKHHYMNEWDDIETIPNVEVI